MNCSANEHSAICLWVGKLFFLLWESLGESVWPELHEKSGALCMWSLNVNVWGLLRIL